MEACIFCKIINKELPAEIVCESEEVIGFPDMNPSADIHILIVPKKHITEMMNLNEDHSKILVEIYKCAQSLVKKNHLEDDVFRIVVNGGKAQHVPHLHFHLLGGEWKRQI